MNQSQRIHNCISKLRLEGATGIGQYERRLKENAGNEEVFNDLLEARAALMFLHYDWRVRLRESPDLELRLNGELLYAEVKHFREKGQDRLDEQATRATTTLVRTGDLRKTEKSEAWEQIVAVAVKKAQAGQYIQGFPNILVVESSSESLDLMAASAAHAYDEEAQTGRSTVALNGIMLTNIFQSLGPEPDKAFHFAQHIPRRCSATLYAVSGARSYPFQWASMEECPESNETCSAQSSGVESVSTRKRNGIIRKQ